MAFKISKVDVWAGEIADRPGALAAKLEPLEAVGANLDFVIARPLGERPGYGVVYVAPLKGAKQTKAAAAAGLSKSSINALRLVGPDRPGLAATIGRCLADAGLNIAGMSGAGVGKKAIFYVRFDSDGDVTAAKRVLAKLK